MSTTVTKIKLYAILIGITGLQLACNNTESDLSSKIDTVETNNGGRMFVRNDLAYIRQLKVDVPLTELEPLLLSEGFKNTAAKDGHITYEKKDDSWYMMVDFTIPSEYGKIIITDIKVSGINNKVSNDEIFDTISTLFQESLGEPETTGTGLFEGDKYEGYAVYDNMGGISYSLRIEKNQVEVNIVAFEL